MAGRQVPATYDVVARRSRSHFPFTLSTHADPLASSINVLLPWLASNSSIRKHCPTSPLDIVHHSNIHHQHHHHQQPETCTTRLKASIMANYVDASTQTIWAGLAKRELVRPDILFTAPDTTTPPDEMITDKAQTLDRIPSITDASVASTLLERRTNRPGLVARISLPSSELDDEILPSPPPTQANLSPVPAANKLHAGHTPLIPRALSPVLGDSELLVEVQPFVEERVATPEHDQGLKGPLVLPTNPVDGADDHIALDALDDELAKIAKEQKRFSKLRDAPEPTPAETTADTLPLSRKVSADSRQSSEDVVVVDGVRLKNPPLNFGMPLGQAPRRRSEAEGS
ncbi:uncharacterized protein K460DRAFT_332513 [Cucurbitaria berberidis CBS 394.84]|uniref:Uncharacterized protein n=1 Tax=Cucurbitaria berberidis CBS 394.84 TaxID=1168544 RepID=A0A9P4GJM9_9PLEO|nr:uncharacterized protein K460DRAFT_332513 [Cucurbitaria berberidis CBS 394.84]KAF1847483.1 hypothetical protein K460DRAFT_332513 [Cucurbitaria berberidis CBS 394.84]